MITCLDDLEFLLNSRAELTKEECDEIRGYLARTVHHSWSIDDVKEAGTTLDVDLYKLTDQECLEILGDFYKLNVEGDYGLTWVGLREQVNEFCLRTGK